MLIVEITPEIKNQPFESAGIAEFGEYRYVVKSGRRVVTEGVVHNPERKHFSRLLAHIAEDAKQNEFKRIMS